MRPEAAVRDLEVHAPQDRGQQEPELLFDALDGGGVCRPGQCCRDRGRHLGADPVCLGDELRIDPPCLVVGDDPFDVRRGSAERAEQRSEIHRHHAGAERILADIDPPLGIRGPCAQPADEVVGRGRPGIVHASRTTGTSAFARRWNATP